MWVPGSLKDGVPVPHQQPADEFGGAGEEGVAEVLGDLGGYGSGFVRL